MMSREEQKAAPSLVLTFPGQGSYNRLLLIDLFTRGQDCQEIFEGADAHCRRILGHSFLSLVETSSPEEHDRRLAGLPDLDQVGIFLSEALVGRILVESGLEPRLLLGHSLGDLAALATAGVFSIDQGLRIVCQRVLALQEVSDAGGMAALGVGEERALELLDELGGEEIELAVVNHPRQSVVSGPQSQLRSLVRPLAEQGISLTLLKSRYPFHSSWLRPAVRPFEIALQGYAPGTPRIPVSISTENRLLRAGDSLPALLGRQFTSRLNFPALLERVTPGGELHFVECAAGGALNRIIARNLSGDGHSFENISTESGGLSSLLDRLGKQRSGYDSGTKSVAIRRPVRAATTQDGAESPAAPPIAVVAIGCVLPGASNPETFWQNMESGVSGIVDLAALDPEGSADFLSPNLADEPVVVPDKTYTLLNGAIPEVPYSPSLLGEWYSEKEFTALTKGQRLLAVGLGQCLEGATKLPPAGRCRCILGATADGFAEYDEAMVLEAMAGVVGDLELAPELRSRTVARLEALLGRQLGQAEELSQHRSLQTVVDRLIPGGADGFIVDTACSSSLYSINLGIKDLLRGAADVVFAGGVFAPGPANNALFAQFRGLTATGSKPLDADADGVVFGDGAAIVQLKRLSDALEQGDPVLGVLRGMGLSSDGKSPSINVPRSAGQSIAIRRAYETSGIDPATIQYIEAHATATPVGDAVEFRSLLEVFPPRPPGERKIGLGSVKALTGHTGWASGAASLIKILKAFEHRRIPPQFNFRSVQEGIPLDDSPFSISTESKDWAPNHRGLPRRAGINGFGFGGTNAHLVVEEFDGDYHRHLSSVAPAVDPPPATLAIVAATSLFPDPSQLSRPTANNKPFFDRQQLRLPAKKLLLPDVTEHMDASQFLAALGAEQLLAELGLEPSGLGKEIAVVLGLEAKTERGIAATQRIFLDRLIRLVDKHGKNGWLPDEVETLRTAIDRVRAEVMPSGPYTLPGLMPNVSASRISNLFDFHGPNIVIDRGALSLPQALAVGAELVAHGDCQLAIAGGVNALGGANRDHHEGLLLLGLTHPETARSEGFPILAHLNLAASDAPSPAPAKAAKRYLGASGALEVLEALATAQRGAEAVVQLANGNRGGAPLLRFTPSQPLKAEARENPARDRTTAPTAVSAVPAPPSPDSAGPDRTYDFVQDTPIYRLTPRLHPLPASEAPRSLAGLRVLWLCDQGAWWHRSQSEELLRGVSSTILSPDASPVPGSLVVESTALDQGTVPKALTGFPFDAIVTVQNLADKAPDALLTDDPEAGRRLLDLLFVTVKAGYETIREEKIPLLSLSLSALADDQPAPESGLFAGFLKSVARELPGVLCRAISTDALELGEGLRMIEQELAEDPAPVEILYRQRKRHGLRLEHLETLARKAPPPLDESCVVIATGGGRGVTAVLVEELLERFGCTVIALGRTNLKAVPASILRMTAEELKAHEATFYSEELARDPKQGIKTLKRRFGGYQAAHELNQVVTHCNALPGRFEYHSLDLNDGPRVASFVADLHRRLGRLDLVVHGAGIQQSQLLTKKKLSDFQRIIGTKLSSLGHLYRAAAKAAGPAAVHFHLLTSAFSYLGNDGQPDYGAANETMNRLAAALNAAPGTASWSAMAWLGWAGIGMTRGSEFAALAARRRLRGVTREEGREIFGELMSGPPMAAINVLLAAGEIDFYHPSVAPLDEPSRTDEAPAAPAVQKARQSEVRPLSLSVEAAPFLIDHTVRGVPTLPGAFIIGLAAEAAHRLRPKLSITSFEDTRFRRLVRVYPRRETEVRMSSEVVSEDRDETVVQVRLLADFTHKSGLVLQRDAIHTEIFVHLAPSLPAPNAPPQPNGRIRRAAGNGGVSLPDPYLMEGSPVRLNGRFKSLSEVLVEDNLRVAQYKLAQGDGEDSPFGYMIPNLILVDALWRFGTVQQNPTVYVPERCRRMGVYFDFCDFAFSRLREPVVFLGANPEADGDQLRVGPIEARSEDGRLFLTVEGGICRRFGEVQHAS